MSRDFISEASKTSSTPPEFDFDPVISRANYESWFPELNSLLIDKLLIYQGELNKFNKALHLVPPRTLKFADSLHFSDAILASSLIRPHLLYNAPLHDFGSGAGFPGLVFALMNPDIEVVLVDRDSAKLEFCTQVALAAEIRNVAVVVKDVEDFEHASIRNVTARGYNTLAKSVMRARKTVAPGGRFFHLKGQSWASELSAIPPQLLTLWTPSLIGRYSLPEERGEMALVLTEKSTE
ncbi:MAG: methyltransferase domain-containing protein [Proteobacteria bacterium]|nr:MAG: methyltransferase domain-containing protein [Pseudomonadota bacterium]